MFQFPQPPQRNRAGRLGLRHGIQDLATTPQLVAGGNWTECALISEDSRWLRVRINEFLTEISTRNALKDQFGQLEDWIELYQLRCVQRGPDGLFPDG